MTGPTRTVSVRAGVLAQSLLGQSRPRRKAMGYSDLDPASRNRRPWNAGTLVGAKRPLKPREVWAIRFFLSEHGRLRDRALFDRAIDSNFGDAML
jgi:hypothetical protein